MSDRPDMRELVGADVPGPELERLARVDELLRQTPPPPEVPDALATAVLAIPGRDAPVRRRRRLALGLAFAAALAAVTFGIGRWVGGSPEIPVAEQITLNATANAPKVAKMVIDVLPADQAGNWAMVAEVNGLPKLPVGDYYEVWMTKSGRLAVSCGRFVVDATGQAHRVWLNAPYEFDHYDRWVVVAVGPSREPSTWLLDGPVTSPA